MELKLQKKFVFTKSVHAFVKLTKVVYNTYHKLLRQNIKKWDKIIHFSFSLSPIILKRADISKMIDYLSPQESDKAQLSLD